MRLGPYEVLETLGRGATGAVFRARAPSGEEVAIKQLLRASEGAASRFARESRLQSALGAREGFVPLLDFGAAPGGPWIAMPLLRRGTLRDRLARGPLAVDEALAVAIALCRAMGRAHALGLVHRDLKPENVLFADDGAPLVADLGLAKHFEGEQSAALSATGTLLGTAGYMASEQMRDAKRVGPPADVFALGVIVFECLTGAAPFAGETVLEVIANVERGEHRRLRALRKEVPRAVAAAVERALAPDPAARFEHGDAFADALAAARRGGTSRRGPLLVAGALVAIGVAAPLVARALVPRERPAVSPPPSVRKDVRVADRGAEIAALASEAIAAERAHDHEKALATASRAIELGRGDPAGWIGRGTVHLIARENEDAVADFQEATRLAPRDAQTRFVLAQALYEVGRLDDSLVVCHEAIALGPGVSGYRKGLGAILERKGDLPAAIAAFADFLRIEPGDAATWEHRGELQARSGDRAGAIESLTRALDLRPDAAALYYNRGLLELQSERGDLADADADRALAADPRFANAWIVKGACLRERKKPREAIPAYTKGLELGGDRATLLFHRGGAYLEAGELPAARADFEEALRSNPTPPVATAARQALARLGR